MKKNMYEEILDQLKEIRPVTVRTDIRGDSGDIAGGLQRRLLPSVTPVEDVKGRRFARVTPTGHAFRMPPRLSVTALRTPSAVCG